MKKKVDLKPIISAIAAGGGFSLGYEAVAKRVDFVNENFLVVKSTVGGIIGATLVYLAKPSDESQKAAGYAVLGVAGAAGATKLSTVLVTSDNESVNGLPERTKRIVKRVLDRSNKAPKMIGGGGRPGVFNQRPHEQRPQEQRPNTALASMYGALAYSDLIY